MTTSEFTCFPRGAVEFLVGLTANNNKPWFEAHRHDYEEYLLGPSRAFAAAMAERLTAISPPELAPIAGSPFRIYRDVRFSKDKTPYKTHLGIAFGSPGAPKGESPGYYFHLDPPRLMIGAGMHAFPKPFLELYREAVVDDMSGEKLESTLHQVSEAGMEVWGESYKRVPRGYDAAHPRADLLRYSGLFAASNEELPEALHSVALLDYCVERYATMVHVLTWLLDVAEKAAA